jgi:hypothetical protein
VQCPALPTDREVRILYLKVRIADFSARFTDGAMGSFTPGRNDDSTDD